MNAALPPVADDHWRAEREIQFEPERGDKSDDHVERWVRPTQFDGTDVGLGKPDLRSEG